MVYSLLHISYGTLVLAYLPAATWLAILPQTANRAKWLRPSMPCSKYHWLVPNMRQGTEARSEACDKVQRPVTNIQQGIESSTWSVQHTIMRTTEACYLRSMLSLMDGQPCGPMSMMRSYVVAQARGLMTHEGEMSTAPKCRP